MGFREQINQELAHITLPENFEEKILCHTRKKTKAWRYQAVCIVLCLILMGGTVSAGWFVYSKIRVNDEILPELELLEKKTVNASKTEPDDVGIYRDQYGTYQELCSELGMELLYSNLADGNEYMQIQRKTDNVNWNKIYSSKNRFCHCTSFCAMKKRFLCYAILYKRYDTHEYMHLLFPVRYRRCSLDYTFSLTNVFWQLLNNGNKYRSVVFFFQRRLHKSLEQRMRPVGP